ncbi:MAG: DUF1566 domain-containing protein [Deltaproteobacteria bacterium]|nr:DUF1566 domain-containing protein [Deltaproteobacteria bacterium]
MTTKSMLLPTLLVAALLSSGCKNDGAADQRVDIGLGGDAFGGDAFSQPALPFTIADTNQRNCYASNGAEIPCAGTGQDGARIVNPPSYTDNGDGTVTDNVTGVIWQQSADTNKDGTVDVNDKFTQSNAVGYCQKLTLGGHSDWELPDIKTMYSLIDFSGEDVSGLQGNDTSKLQPFIDKTIFGYGYGDTSAGERIIDAQWATRTLYVSNPQQMFGVNLADGRIKGYGDPLGNQANNKLFYVQCVRNKGNYGQNDFTDNGDGTITDKATGLMWEQSDNGDGVDWDQALAHCSSSATGGHSDWRLPNAKELQSIVDYARSPGTSGSPALDARFKATSLTNEAGEGDFGFYWTSTTHKNTSGINTAAVYISFGRALGYMQNAWLDVHGAGAQRSDPKQLSSVSVGQQGYQSAPAQGGSAIVHGPQGDVVRGLNYVRCVRNAS